MKIRASIFLMIMLLFVNGNAYADVNNFNMAFTEINNLEFNNLADKEEGRIQISYESNNTLEEERNNIDNIMYKLNLRKSNSVYIAKNGCEFITNIISSRNKTYVDIISSDNYHLDCGSIDILRELKDKKNLVFSNTIKYKVKDGKSSEMLNYLKNKLSQVSTINYSGGVFGTGYISKRKITFAIAHYDTNSYLLIGNPIINMSY